MRMLLTSDGVLDGPVHDALLELLGKPIGECRTVVGIDAMLPFPGDKGGMLDHLQNYRALGWDVAGRLGGPAWFLEDGSALLVRDPAAEPEVVSNGHWLHFDAHGVLVGSG